MPTIAEISQNTPVNENDVLKQRLIERLAKAPAAPVKHGIGDIATFAKDFADKGQSTLGKVGYGTIGAILGAASSMNDPDMAHAFGQALTTNPFEKVALSETADKMKTMRMAYDKMNNEQQNEQTANIGQFVGQQDVIDAQKGIAADKNKTDLTIAGLKEQADAQARAEKAASDKKSKDFDMEGKLRDTFIKSNDDFNKIKGSYNRILATVKTPSAAGDLALIFNYIKMLDPGSTVREGEFANAQNSAGIPDKVRAMYNRAISGERLSVEMRSDFITQSKALYDNSLMEYEKNKANTIRLAESYGLNPKNVLFETNLDNVGKAGTGETLTATNPDTKERIKSTDGGKTWQPM